ncbi:EAL domain-containing protein [Massilia sp. TSP1-1-2]|uniref:EAL domain-containing protein n=1 Tax=Massilia sp. TSP1-1-2 TaxID=2804649 RepID=UPI003CEA8609
MLISSGRWVLREACTQNVAWQRMGVPPISMGINLSALQFGNASLLADIRSALLHSGMDLSLLELELTEHMVIQNLEQVMDILGAIKREGGC